MVRIIDQAHDYATIEHEGKIFEISLKHDLFINESDYSQELFQIARMSFGEIKSVYQVEET